MLWMDLLAAVGPLVVIPVVWHRAGRWFGEGSQRRARRVLRAQWREVAR